MCLQEFMYRLKQEAEKGPASVIQLVENRSFKPEVASSILAGSTGVSACSSTEEQLALNQKVEGSNPSRRIEY
jgi:hypothetical protein